jgi:hypothetical protein
MNFFEIINNRLLYVVNDFSVYLVCFLGVIFYTSQRLCGLIFWSLKVMIIPFLYREMLLAAEL